MIVRLDLPLSYNFILSSTYARNACSKQTWNFRVKIVNIYVIKWEKIIVDHYMCVFQ